MPRHSQKRDNPISLAVSSWLESLPPTIFAGANDDDAASACDRLLASAPRRWVVYEPMLLLPSGSFTGPSSPWPALLAVVSHEQRAALWTDILRRVGSAAAPPSRLTHLAANEGIPLHTRDGNDGGSEENKLRSPSGLRMLHGDFGPSTPAPAPAPADFAAAFWVSARQNGIAQTWAPRWTMFSRGNVKEKARLLSFHAGAGGGDARWAVDLYAGIGYFVFSYARLGLRVLGWELNPWSVEGLRRGAVTNGWSVRVVRGADLGRPTAEVVGAATEQIVVFEEDNAEAGRRVHELRASGLELAVLHVNCGLLPSSAPAWRPGWEMLTAQRADQAGWLHLHENVGVADIERRRAEVQALFDGWATEHGEATADVEHVELVKTFAPGVWHCVLDVYIITKV